LIPGEHAQAIVACDFLVAITTGFRVLCVFVAMEVGDHSYRFVIHDHDSNCSQDLDVDMTNFELKVLRTPVRAPKANGYCQRLVSTIRRGCLDFAIPFNEINLRRTLREWVNHYNRGLPHLALGPGIPAPSADYWPMFTRNRRRHEFPESTRTTAHSIREGLQHEYGLEQNAT
jgi:putative transposase